MKREPILQSLPDFKFLCLLTMLLLSFVRAAADDPRLVIDSGGHTAIIRQIIFTRDGRYLISAGDDKVIRVWEVATGKVVRTIQGEIGDGNEGKIYAVALSPDDRYLAVGGFLAGTPQERTAIRIHDFRSGEVIRLLKGHENVVYSLAFSPDGRWLASGSADKTVRVWDWASTPTKDPKTLRGHSDFVQDVAFSPDSRRVVSASYDRSLKLWDVASGARLADLTGHHTDQVWSVAFSPDGQYIVSGGNDKRVLLWEGKTGKFIKELHKQGNTVDDLCFSPDGERLLTGSGDGNGNVNIVLAVPSGQIITQFDQHDSIVMATAFAPDGKLAATAGGGAKLIHLWNPENGKIVKTLGGKGAPIWAVGFARDGQSIAFGTKMESSSINQYGPLQKNVTLASVDGESISLGGAMKNDADYLRARTTGGDTALKTIMTKDPNLQIIRGGQVFKTIMRDSTSGYAHQSYTFTGDGRYIVSGGGSGFLTLYETGTGQQVHPFVGHTGDVWAVAVSPDNQTLVSGSNDQTIKLWDIASGKNLLTIFVATDNEWVVWTPEGYYTSSLNGDRYIGWHVNQGVDKAAKFYSAAQFKEKYYRPDVVAEYLQSRDIEIALKTANEKRGSRFAAESNAASSSILASIPPVVFIRAPERDEVTVNTATLEVQAEAEAAPNTLPVSGIEVLINGSLAGRAKGAELVMRVPLQPGENILSVTATNGKATSKPKEKKITYTGKADALPNLRLLAIGISKYKNPESKLDFADRDAEEIVKAYDAQRGKLFDQVETRTLLNEKATREEIIRGLRWLKSDVNQGDYRILFISGHGGVDGKGEYFFYAYGHDPGEDPEIYDVKGSTLWDSLDILRAAKTILIIDTCRAAAVASSGKRKQDGGLMQELKRAKGRNQGLLLYAASANDEPSKESPVCRLGAFTCAFLEGLKGSANRDGNDWVDAAELGDWVPRRVQELTGKEQHGIYDPPPSFIPFAIFAIPPNVNQRKTR